MEMVEVKTSELIGAALDWAVAVVEGWEPVRGSTLRKVSVVLGIEIECLAFAGKHIEGAMPEPRSYYPSTDWSQGGPLIEKYDVWLSPITDCEPSGWDADVYELDGSEGTGVRTIQGCATPLIAACRAIVAAKLGDTVLVPAELL